MAKAQVNVKKELTSGWAIMPLERRTAFALVVEDHPLVADSLVACIHSCAAGLRVEIVESLRAALRILARGAPPVLIVSDLNLLDANGSKAIEQLRAAAPQAPLLVFTALDDEALRQRAKQAGAAAYLVKTMSIETLRHEISLIIGERRNDCPAKAARTVKFADRLTPKQITVLEQLSIGRSNKEIAARLEISDETVSSHVKEILARLGVKNRTQAVVRYLQAVGHDDHRD